MTFAATKLWLAAVAGLAVMLPLAAQGPVEASADGYVLLTDNYGARIYIGLAPMGRETPDEPIKSFRSVTMSGERLGDVFAQLCLAKPFDRLAYDAARVVVLPDFVSQPQALADFSAPNPLFGMSHSPAVQIVQERSPYGIASLWSGEGAESLKNRQYRTYSGQLIITGPVKPANLYSPQCNLTVRVSGIGDGRALLDAVGHGATGFAETKRVEKPKYAYAIWKRSVNGGRSARIRVDADDLQTAVQTVHLSVQSLPDGKK